jgi:hypothetical protein
LLGVGAELATNDDDRLIQRDPQWRAGHDQRRRPADRSAAAQHVAPTLTIRPGFPVRVVVTRDIVLEPYGRLSHGQAEAGGRRLRRSRVKVSLELPASPSSRLAGNIAEILAQQEGWARTAEPEQT